MENDIEALAEQIKDAEQHLAELRKEYRELRTAGLRAAIDARNEADKVLREELKSLGYRDPFRTQRISHWVTS
tara:strand:+ start:401 stop:619 length:219 start_codon:yes stop_codon:yes gene_type:complete